jgi:hypothetical protein
MTKSNPTGHCCNSLAPFYPNSIVFGDEISAQSGVLTVEPDPVGDCVPVNGLISPRGIRIASIGMYTYPEELAAACAVAGVMLIFLSPYCPFWNPVELVFSQIKSFLRRHAPEFHRVFRMSRNDYSQLHLITFYDDTLSSSRR